jgi:hypothetical protein
MFSPAVSEIVAEAVPSEILSRANPVTPDAGMLYKPVPSPIKCPSTTKSC